MRDVLASLGRRWYLTATGVVATAALGGAALYLVPPTYEATGSFVLLPPASTVDAGGNPFLQLGGLNQVSDILTRSLMAQSAAESIQEKHPSATYTVAPDPATSGPIIVVTADDHSSEGAASTLSDVMKLLPQKLADLQKALGYTGNTQITSAVLAKDNRPETIRKSQTRALIAAVGAGLVMTGLMVALIDGLIERRNRARHQKTAEDSPIKPRAPDESTAASIAESSQPESSPTSPSSNGRHGRRRPGRQHPRSAVDAGDSTRYSVARRS